MLVTLHTARCAATCEQGQKMCMLCGDRAVESSLMLVMNT